MNLQPAFSDADRSEGRPVVLMTPEVAALLGYSVRRVRALAAAGVIPSRQYAPGAEYRFVKHEVLAWWEKQKPRAARKALPVSSATPSRTSSPGVAEAAFRIAQRGR